MMHPALPQETPVRHQRRLPLIECMLQKGHKCLNEITQTLFYPIKTQPSEKQLIIAVVRTFSCLLCSLITPISTSSLQSSAVKQHITQPQMTVQHLVTESRAEKASQSAVCWAEHPLGRVWHQTFLGFVKITVQADREESVWMRRHKRPFMWMGGRTAPTVRDQPSVSQDACDNRRNPSHLICIHKCS